MFDSVVLGDIIFRAWYPSYHVKEIVGKGSCGWKEGDLERLYVCNHYFRYSKKLMVWARHVRNYGRRLGGNAGIVPGR